MNRRNRKRTEKRSKNKVDMKRRVSLCSTREANVIQREELRLNISPIPWLHGNNMEPENFYWVRPSRQGP